MGDLKYCSQCKEHKPPTDFNRNRCQPSGLSTRCKRCNALYQRSYQQRRKEAGGQRLTDRSVTIKQPRGVRRTRRFGRYSAEQQGMYRQFFGEKAPAHCRRIEGYGITPDEYIERHQSQGGLCAVCKQPNKGRLLVVDHCHDTGLVRGLLCHGCNICVGYIEKDLIRTGKIFRYLFEAEDILAEKVREPA